MADCVEKLICASERERLIQDQAPTRNNDSRTDPPGFLYCKFFFHSARSASFSTQSALSRSGGVRPRMSAVEAQQTRARWLLPCRARCTGRSRKQPLREWRISVIRAKTVYVGRRLVSTTKPRQPLGGRGSVCTTRSGSIPTQRLTYCSFG